MCVCGQPYLPVNSNLSTERLLAINRASRSNTMTTISTTTAPPMTLGATTTARLDPTLLGGVPGPVVPALDTTVVVAVVARLDTVGLAWMDTGGTMLVPIAGSGLVVLG